MADGLFGWFFEFGGWTLFDLWLNYGQLMANDCEWWLTDVFFNSGGLSLVDTAVHGGDLLVNVVVNPRLLNGSWRLQHHKHS